MVFFVGEYARQLDERGRFILPAKVREKLSFINPSPSIPIFCFGIDGIINNIVYFNKFMLL